MNRIDSVAAREGSGAGRGSEHEIQHSSGLFGLGAHDSTGLRREFGPAGLT